MAEIHLKYRNNKKLYAQCYQELANQGNNVHSYILLGQAYMQIQEPEKAIVAYQDALKLNPEDPALASRIGHALVATHDYQCAVQYYQTAVNADPTKVYLAYQLARLYFQLKQYDKATAVLENALGNQKEPDPKVMSENVKCHRLLADVLEGAGNIAGKEKELIKAWKLQINLVTLLGRNNPNERRLQCNIACDICFSLAGYYRKQSAKVKAMGFYNEALKRNESHVESRLALASLFLENNELEKCEKQCEEVRKTSPCNKEAIMMLADLFFRQNDYDKATEHFQQLLGENPTEYNALAKLLKLLRRAGRIKHDANQFLKLAKRKSPQVEHAAGFHYCQGLYAMYTNDQKDALSEFNHCREDAVWGMEARIFMVEIYLRPIIQDTTEVQIDKIQAASKLLNELKDNCQNQKQMLRKYKVLSAYCTMASKDKSSIEQTNRNMQQMVSEHKEYVPALLALAKTQHLLNQSAKCRNTLKTISRLKRNPEYAEEFELGWLMLAGIYINQSKYDIAQDLCLKCLKHNKSCAKAWEMYGQINEKEQAYIDAAEKYEKAWDYMNESSSRVGYKLAFNYLKAKRHVEAIDVCHKIRTRFTDKNDQKEIAKIKKEILDKARLAIRA